MSWDVFWMFVQLGTAVLWIITAVTNYRTWKGWRELNDR